MAVLFPARKQVSEHTGSFTPDQPGDFPQFMDALHAVIEPNRAFEQSGVLEQLGAFSTGSQ